MGTFVMLDAMILAMERDNMARRTHYILRRVSELDSSEGEPQIRMRFGDLRVASRICRVPNPRKA